MASACKVRLQSSDGEKFEVDKAVAFESETIKRMIQDIGEHSVLPLPEVRGNILAKVIEYCKFHVEAAKISDGKTAISPDDVEKWDQEFAEMDPLILFKLVPVSMISTILLLGCLEVVFDVCLGFRKRNVEAFLFYEV